MYFIIHVSWMLWQMKNPITCVTCAPYLCKSSATHSDLNQYSCIPQAMLYFNALLCCTSKSSLSICKAFFSIHTSKQLDRNPSLQWASQKRLCLFKQANLALVLTLGTMHCAATSISQHSRPQNHTWMLQPSPHPFLSRPRCRLHHRPCLYECCGWPQNLAERFHPGKVAHQYHIVLRKGKKQYMRYV